MQSNHLKHSLFNNTTPSITAVIIEDDAVWSQTLGKDLEAYSEITVLETIASGEKAKKDVPKLQPHLLFINVEMPNGIECLGLCLLCVGSDLRAQTAVTKEKTDTLFCQC